MRWYSVLAMVVVGTVLIYGARMAHAMAQPRGASVYWLLILRDWWQTRGRDVAC